VLLASTALSALPAMAQDVGTAAAVNPLSQSTPPGGGTRVLRIGTRVVHKERIQTTAEGTVQLLFIDKTTLNIGPNSNLVIDSFVYDPSAGTGKIATSLTKGALRFVGGQLSHQGAATVSTPVAAIGIRGGIATIAHGPEGTRIINDFGWLSITNGCGTTFLRRTGFAVSVADWNSCPTEPQRVTQSETNHYLELLTSKTGQNGGAPSLPTDALVGQFGIGQFNLKTAVGVGWSADCLAFSTSGCGSAGREAWGRTQRAALKENLEGSREDSPPALQARQLLRSFCEFA